MTSKEWLMRYSDAWREAEDVELRLTQIRLRYRTPSAIEYSDMPKAHKQTDLSDYMSMVERYEKILIEKYEKCIWIEIQIYQAIDRLEDESERILLRYRYIDRLRREEIAEKMHCVQRTVFRIHGRALLHIKPFCH